MNTRRMAPLVLFLIAGVCGARADQRDWQARWIGATSDSITSTASLTPPNSWFCFRKQFDLPTAPQEPILCQVAVDAKYWLWVNGRLAVYEGQLKRGPTPHDTYYDSDIDIAPYLTEGANTLAVLVWHFGKDGFSHKNSGKAGLLFEMEATTGVVVSDATWKAIPHPAYGDTGEPHPNYRLPESNIRFDARRDIGPWTAADYDDSGWPQAIELAPAGAAPWNRLVPRPIPLWKDYGLRAYENADSFPTTATSQVLQARLPYNAQVSPYLKIEAPAGLTIDIRSDNYVVTNEPTVRMEYVTREGVQEFETLGWLNGHEILYRIPPDVRILDLGYRETGYDCAFSGRFECDDPFLNTLWEKSLRTLYLNMRDTYMDCPDRERAQWWGDEIIELGQAFYALSLESHHLARKGILELVHWQKEDGALFSPIPAGNWDKELPTQMLASVGWFGFWTYYLHSGDRDTLVQAYPGVRRYLDLWNLDDEGLVEPREGGWLWGDWGEHKDMPILFNAWYYLALKGQRQMALLAREQRDLPAIEKKMATMRDSFVRTFWTGSEFRSADHTGPTDDRANAMAVLAGLARPSMYPSVRQVLMDQRHASPYMEKYVLEALYVMGYADDALTRMQERFGAMVESPLTTLGELWGSGEHSYGGSANHAWSGGALTLLCQYAAGLAPEDPGYEVFRIEPQMGRLQRINMVTPTVRGPIHVTLKKDHTGFSMELDTPAGAIPIIGIPRDYVTTDTCILANDAVVWAGGSPVAVQDAGLHFEGEDTAFIRFRATGGKWRFVAHEP